MSNRVLFFFSIIMVSFLAASGGVPVTYGDVTDFKSEKATYVPGDVVALSGTSTSVLVGIEVDDPRGVPILIATVRVSTTDKSFVRSFKLAADSVDGTYTATASDDTGKATLTFTVGKGAVPPSAVTIQFGDSSSISLLPETAIAGSVVSMVWRVDGQGALSHTAVRYGITPGDAGKQFYGWADFTKQYAAVSPPIDIRGGRVFSDMVPIPKTTGATLYFRAHAIVDGKDYYTEEHQIRIAEPTQPPFDPAPLQANITQLQKDVANIKTDMQEIRNESRQGPQGPPGPPGVTGLQGPMGPPGPQAAASLGPDGFTIAGLVIGFIGIIIAVVAWSRARTAAFLLARIAKASEACPYCSHRNPTGVKYCGNCGREIRPGTRMR